MSLPVYVCFHPPHCLYMLSTCWLLAELLFFLYWHVWFHCFAPEIWVYHLLCSTILNFNVWHFVFKTYQQTSHTMLRLIKNQQTSVIMSRLIKSDRVRKMMRNTPEKTEANRILKIKIYICIPLAPPVHCAPVSILPCRMCIAVHVRLHHYDPLEFCICSIIVVYISAGPFSLNWSMLRYTCFVFPFVLHLVAVSYTHLTLPTTPYV